jgi:hypothetical protein
MQEQGAIGEIECLEYLRSQWFQDVLNFELNVVCFAMRRIPSRDFDCERTHVPTDHLASDERQSLSNSLRNAHRNVPATATDVQHSHGSQRAFGSFSRNRISNLGRCSRQHIDSPQSAQCLPMGLGIQIRIVHEFGHEIATSERHKAFLFPTPFDILATEHVEQYELESINNT